jgi:hypothetical protein
MFGVIPLRFRIIPYTVFVGPVPFVITPTFTFFIGVSGDVNGGFSVGATQTASVTGGLSYSNGQWSKISNPSPPSFTPDPIGLDASLSAKAYAGVKIDLDVDEILSPEFKPDVFLQLDVNTLSNPWWTVSAGLEGAGSVDVTLFGLADVVSFDLPNLFEFSQIIAQASGGFLPAPTLSGVAPNTTLAGSSGLTLTLTGSNFVPGAVAYFNGMPLATSYVSPNQVTALLGASSLSVAGTSPITAANPDISGAISNPVAFTVGGIPSSKPGMVTGSATAVTTNSATLGGTVNPNGLDTHFWFLYGASSSLSGASQTPSQDLGSGSSASGISANISGLSANTTYYFQLQATSSAGVASGAINSFKTNAAEQAPTASTGSASAVTVNSATLGGTVNPNGLDTHFWFLYGASSSLSGPARHPAKTSAWVAALRASAPTSPGCWRTRPITSSCRPLAVRAPPAARSTASRLTQRGRLPRR